MEKRRINPNSFLKHGVFKFDTEGLLNEATPRTGYGTDDEAVKGPDETEEEGLKDLEEGGQSKGEQSATRVDYPGAKDGDEETGHGESAGDQSKTKGDYLKEDSGEDEAWHEWKNEHADDDHIREIEHHLRALKG